MKKAVLFLSGWTLLLLAAIGVFLPILPTTPFVLLAALCFSCSSEKMHRFLLKSRLFGPYIENYRTGRGVPAAAKARGIAMLWLLLAVSAFAMRKAWATAMFAVIGIGVTIHLLLLKTRKRQNPALPAQDEEE